METKTLIMFIIFTIFIIIGIVVTVIGAQMVKANPIGSAKRKIGWLICLGIIGLIINNKESKKIRDDKSKELEMDKE